MNATPWHALDTVQTLEKLRTDPVRGLSEAEARTRLETYGPNELKAEEKISPWTVFFRQFTNVLIIILLVATVLSALVGEIFDAALILVIVVFCAVLGFVQEYRAERALDALKKMLSPIIRVIRDGHERDIPTKDVVPGDIMLLEAGYKIPADARLIESASLKCDEAPLTGESVPVDKDIKPLPSEMNISDRRNMVFTGTTVSYGRGKAVVTDTGSKTEFGKIAEEVAQVEKVETPLEKRTREIGKWLGIISLVICLLIVAISIAREGLTPGGRITIPFLIQLVMFAIALAVAAVPEALAAIVTGSLAIGMHQMAKKNALIRKMPAVETLGCTTVICSDKTGTLTKGEMTVRRLFASGRMADVSGAGYAPTGEFKGAGSASPLEDKTLDLLLKSGVLCNDASLDETEGKWFVRGDPTEGSLIVAAAKAGLNTVELRIENERVEEIPFSSERKRMTTIHRMEDGRMMAIMKGAPELVLERCARIMADGAVRDINAYDRAAVHEANAAMAGDALRVLGFAYRELTAGIETNVEALEAGMTFLGLQGMIDPPRDEVKEAIRTCREVKIKPVMITGDHKLTALAVAREIGIYDEGDLALTGDDLEKMSEEDLERIVDKVTLYARVSPMDKIKIVRAWKKRGEVVAMTGDGVNDAPALKQADIGIAMGITGTEVAKEAADMVLSDDNFATIVSAIERGRWIYDNIKKYLVYLLRCNITEVLVIGGGVLALGPEYLPLVPAAILFINLATDGLPALALGISPPDPDIMRRPPRAPNEKVFSKDFIIFLGMAVLVESPFFLFIFLHDLKNITHARTEIFFLFIVVELLIALNSRSIKYSIFTLRPHKWLVLAVCSQIALAFGLVLIPSVRQSFGIQLPSAGDMEIILGYGVFAIICIELIKLYLRKKVYRTE